MSGLHYDNTLGAAFIGFACAAVLYGILIAQIYIYFQRYKLDRPIYKFFVVAVWILETMHSVLTGHAVYHYAITNFGDPLALLVPVWTVIIQVLFGASISVLVKFAFAMRVWRFSNQNVLLVGIISLMNCAILALAILFCCKAFFMETFLRVSELKWVLNSVLSISVTADIVIAASLTYYLHHLRRNVLEAKTLVNALIKYSIETGAVTSLCGIACLVTFDAFPSAFFYMSFYFVLSKLYSNSLMANLNTRNAVKGRGTERSQAPFGEFTIIHTAGQVQTQHSRLAQSDYHKRAPDLEANVIKETISFPGDTDLRSNEQIVTGGYSTSGDEHYSCHPYKYSVSSTGDHFTEYGSANGYLQGVHRTTISTAVVREERNKGGYGESGLDTPNTPLPEYLQAVAALATLREPEPAVRN